MAFISGNFLSPALSLLGPGGASVGSGLADAIVKGFFHYLVKLEEAAVASLVNAVLGTVVKATTSVSKSEGNSWFGTITLLEPVLKLVVGPLLFAGTIGPVLRQDLRRLARVWGVGLPVAVLGGIASVKLTGKGLSATDALSKAIVADVAPRMKSDFIHAISAGLTGGATAITLLLSVVVIAGGLLLWLELAVRAVAIEVAVFFMPLALAGVIWPATSHFAKRFVSLLASLLLMKPVIVGVLALGTAALTANRGGSVVSGTAMLLIAAFSPLALFKMVPLVEVSSVAHLHDLSRQPVRAADRAMRGALSFATSARAVTGGPSAGRQSGDLGVAGMLLSQAGGGHSGGGHSGGGHSGGGHSGGGHSGGGPEDHPLGPARPPSPVSPRPPGPTSGKPAPNAGHRGGTNA
jgi:hypothetical protein